MKKHAKIIGIVMLIGCVLVIVLGYVFKDDSSRIAKNMKGHYYVGYVANKPRYLYFGENNKVAIGIKRKDAFLMTKSYTYKVSKKDKYYQLTFNKKRYRLQLDSDNLPSRLFSLDDSINYTLKDVK